MDKKTKITLGVICAVVVILVAVVFAMGTGKETLGKNILLTIDGENYEVSEYKIYEKLSNLENGDINKVLSEDEKLSAVDSFLFHKVYLNTAKDNKLTLTDDEVDSFETDYEKNKDALNSAGISKEDYIKYKEEVTLAQKVQYDLDEYYEVPNEVYEEVRDAYYADDLNKTYGFRLMTIEYDEPKEEENKDEAKTSETTDEATDTNNEEVAENTNNEDEVDVLENTENNETENKEEEKEDKSRETIKKIAEDVYQKLKDGEDFEELAKEHGATRITFRGNDYVLLNGQLEYATSPFLKSKITNETLYDAVLEMKAGDVSEIIEDTESTNFQILKLESIEEGFVGEGEKELKSIILNEYANNIVLEDIKYEVNQPAYIRTIYGN